MQANTAPGPRLPLIPRKGTPAVTITRSRHLYPVVVLITCLVAPLADPRVRADEKPRKPKASLPADLALVREDSAFIRIEVGRYWNGSEGETLKKVSRAHPIVWTFEASDLEKTVGLAADNVERVLVLIPSFKKMNGVLVLTARKPFDTHKALKVLVPGGQEAKVGTRSYIADNKAKLAAHAADRNTVLAGDPGVLRELLQRGPGKAEALGEAVRAAARSPLLAAGMVPSSLAALVEKASPASKPYLPLFKARSWQVTAEAGKKELRFDFRLSFPDRASAAAGRPALETALRQLDGYLAVAEKEMPSFYKREAPKYKDAASLAKPLGQTLKSARAALGVFKAEQDGERVQGSLRMKVENPATAFLLLLSMVPRPAKEAKEK
jgi:hypothetical protein